MTSEFWRIAAAAVSLSAVLAGCTAVEEGAVTTLPQTFSETAPEAKAAVADGELTLDEFSSLVDSTAECMRRSGLDVSEVRVDAVGEYGWAVVDAPGQDRIIAECRARYLEFVVEWRALNG